MLETEFAQHPRRFRPRTWRFRGALVFAALVAVAVAALIATNLTRGPIVWLWIGILVFPALMVVATGLAARSLLVVPGRYLERARPLRAPLRVPAGDSTEILYYAAVAGTQSMVREVDSPIGVVDHRWAVVRRDGRTVMRLGMRLWRDEDLGEIALRLPAKLTIDRKPIRAQSVAKRHPDYYLPIEMRPRLYATLGVIGIIALGVWTFAALALPFILSQVWGIV